MGYRPASRGGVSGRRLSTDGDLQAWVLQLGGHGFAIGGVSDGRAVLAGEDHAAGAEEGGAGMSGMSAL